MSVLGPGNLMAKRVFVLDRIAHYNKFINLLYKYICTTTISNNMKH
jgi:hypothetical protein